MRAVTKIIILTIPLLALVVFYLYIADNGYSPYNEGIDLTRFSDDEFQKYVKDAGSLENLNITKLTDENLRNAPAIKELIEKSKRKEFPLNTVGILNSTMDEIKHNHQYVAQKYATKYNTNPESYFSTKLADEYQLENFPDSYLYEFDVRFFKYGERYYSFYDTEQLVNYGESHQIQVGVLKHDLTSDRLYVELTDDDWQHIPRVKEAIDKIGTLQEEIRVHMGMSQSDLNKHRQWVESNHGMAVGSFLEYDGEYYQISFWIA